MSVLALSGHAAPPPDIVEGGKAEWRDGPPCRLMTRSGHGPASHVSVAKPVSAPTKVLVRAATMPCPEPRGDAVARRGKTGHEPVQTRRRKSVVRKRGNAPKVARHRGSSADSLRKKVALFKRERDEALEQQKATSEVLHVISSSPGDVAPVFATMLEKAVRICDGSFGMLFRAENGAVRAAAKFSVPPAFVEFWQRGPQRPGPGTALGRMIETRQTIYIVDVKTEPAYVEANRFLWQPSASADFERFLPYRCSKTMS